MTVGADQPPSRCECCAHALSLEAADDNDLLTLRCAVHRRDLVLAMTGGDFAERLDGWFRDHAQCTRVAGLPHAA